MIKPIYSIQLPEGEWVCTTGLTNGGAVSVKDGYFVYSYDPDRHEDVTLIFENQDGAIYTVRSEERDGSFWLIRENN